MSNNCEEYNDAPTNKEMEEYDAAMANMSMMASVLGGTLE